MRRELRTVSTKLGCVARDKSQDMLVLKCLFCTGISKALWEKRTRRYVDSNV